MTLAIQRRSKQAKHAVLAGLVALPLALTALFVPGTTAKADAAVASSTPTCSPLPVNPALTAYITLCRSGSSLHVTNVSQALLTVTAPEQRLILVKQGPPDPGPPSFADEATGLVMSTLPEPVSGQYVPPKETAVVMSLFGAPPVTSTEVYVAVDSKASVPRYGVEVVTKYIEKRLSAPPRALAVSASECAVEVGETWADIRARTGSAPTVEGAWVSAVLFGHKCKSVADEVRAMSAEKPPPATALDELKLAGREVQSNLIDDGLKFLRNVMRAFP